MRFGLFIPQGWRQDLTGIEPRDHWQTMSSLATPRRPGRRLRLDLGLRPLPRRRPSPTARRRTRPGASSTRSPRAPAASAWARCAPAWRTATRPTWRRSRRRRTSSRAAASRWASAPAGTSTSGARTATASRPRASGSRCSTRACRSSSRCGPTAPRPWPASTTRSTAPSCPRCPCRWTGRRCGSPAAARRRPCGSRPSTPRTPTSRAPPTRSRTSRRSCAGTARTSGARSSEITRSSNYNVVIGSTEAEVDDRIAWVEEHLSNTIPDKAPQVAEDFRNGTLVGTPEQIVERLQELQKLGMTYAITYFAEAAYDRSRHRAVREPGHPGAALTAQSPLGDHDGGRDAGVVGDGQVEPVDAGRGGRGGDGADDLDHRLRTGDAAHGRVLPAHPRGRTERLGDGLLGREPRGQGGLGHLPLLGREQPVAQRRHPVQGVDEARDVDDVDADADDHAVPDHSTVTDFARLRGWSTSRPLAVASSHAKICSGTTASSGASSVGRLRHVEHLVGVRQHVHVAVLRDHQGAGTAGADLLDVGDDLRVQRVAAARRRHDDEHRLPLLDERDRAVLQLARGEPLGVDVRRAP